MSMYEAVKHISKQDESSLTVIGMSDLLKEAKIPYTRMGYDSWGNFSYSQVLYVLEGKGYIAKRRNPSKGSTITITSTNDGRTTKVGKMLTANEMEVFRKLGLKSSKEESHNN